MQGLTQEQIKEYMELKARAEKAAARAKVNHAVYNEQLKTYRDYWHKNAKESDKKALESRIEAIKKQFLG